MTASIDDAITVLQNMVIGLNALTQTIQNVEGQATSEGISTATLLKKGAGRVVRISVTTAGTTVGSIYDAASAALVGTANLVAVIPIAAGVVDISMPVQNGIVIVPGTSQVVSVSYS